MRIYFSIGGRKSADDQMIDYVYMPDLMIDRARNVTVHLRHQVARYLKLQFEFASQWILISEMYFESGISFHWFQLDLKRLEMRVLLKYRNRTSGRQLQRGDPARRVTDDRSRESPAEGHGLQL